MQEVKIYTASPSDLSPPVQSESFCVDMVLASDYRELEAKCAALVVENGALKKSEVEFNDYCRHECEDVGDTWVDDFTETPATDAFLAEVTQEAVESLKKEIEWLKKQLLMSVGDIRDLIDYNPENGVLTAKVNFSGRQAGSVIGSQTWQGYYAFSLFGKKCFAHRLAWLLHYGEWPSQPIDHIGEVSEKRHGLVMDGTVDLGGESTYRIIKGEKAMKRLPLGTKFYIAPPALVVPDEMPVHTGPREFGRPQAYVDGWNACRAAMLNQEKSNG